MSLLEVGGLYVLRLSLPAIELLEDKNELVGALFTYQRSLWRNLDEARGKFAENNSLVFGEPFMVLESIPQQDKTVIYRLMQGSEHECVIGYIRYTEKSKEKINLGEDLDAGRFFVYRYVCREW